jgi:hypothetical protein
MKKQTTLNHVTRYYLTRILLFILPFGSYSVVEAQDSINSFEKTELKYMGTVNGKIVFEFDYQRKNNESFTLEIVDQHGYELYRERSREKHYKKQFAIERSDLLNNIITVMVTSRGKPQKFEINRSFRMVEDISIVRQ